MISSKVCAPSEVTSQGPTLPPKPSSNSVERKGKRRRKPKIMRRFFEHDVRGLCSPNDIKMYEKYEAAKNKFKPLVPKGLNGQNAKRTANKKKQLKRYHSKNGGQQQNISMCCCHCSCSASAGNNLHSHAGNHMHGLMIKPSKTSGGGGFNASMEAGGLQHFTIPFNSYAGTGYGTHIPYELLAEIAPVRSKELRSVVR